MELLDSDNFHFVDVPAERVEHGEEVTDDDIGVECLSHVTNRQRNSPSDLPADVLGEQHIGWADGTPASGAESHNDCWDTERALHYAVTSGVACKACA